jgi:hypothetical protein
MPQIIEKFEVSANLATPTPGKPVTFGENWVDAQFPSLRVSPLGRNHDYVAGFEGIDGNCIALGTFLTRFVFHAPAVKVAFDFYVSTTPNPDADAVHVTYRDESHQIIEERDIASLSEVHVGTLTSDSGLEAAIKSIEFRGMPGGVAAISHFVMET